MIFKLLLAFFFWKVTCHHIVMAYFPVGLLSNFEFIRSAVMSRLVIAFIFLTACWSNVGGTCKRYFSAFSARSCQTKHDLKFTKGERHWSVPHLPIFFSHFCPCFIYFPIPTHYPTRLCDMTASNRGGWELAHASCETFEVSQLQLVLWAKRKPEMQIFCMAVLIYWRCLVCIEWDLLYMYWAVFLFSQTRWRVWFPFMSDQGIRTVCF